MRYLMEEVSIFGRLLLVKNKTLLTGLEKSNHVLVKDNNDFKEQNITFANEIEKLKKELNQYGGLSETFLFPLLKFHSDTRCYGATLNFTTGESRPNCTSKEDLAIRFLGFLEELDIYDKDKPKTQERAKNELIKLQERYSFTKFGWYSIHVFKVMVSEFHGRA
jgi:hypothetical protein